MVYSKTVFSIPLLVGWVALSGGFAWGVRNYILYRDAIETEGRVVEVYTYHNWIGIKPYSKTSKSWPIIEFTASNGKKYRFKGHQSTGTVGYKETVLYSAANPQNATVSSFSYLWLPSVVSCFIGLVFIFTARQNKQEQEADDF